MSVFARRIKGMLQLRLEQVWTCCVSRTQYNTVLWVNSFCAAFVAVCSEWSELRKEWEFIDAYKKKQIVWDPKHPLGYNKISSELNIQIQ
jgi:hypothetical protein